MCLERSHQKQDLKAFGPLWGLLAFGQILSGIFFNYRLAFSLHSYWNAQYFAVDCFMALKHVLVKSSKKHKIFLLSMMLLKRTGSVKLKRYSNPWLGDHESNLRFRT